MSSYILSNANRFYAAVEATYGHAAPVSAKNRYPAMRLAAQQVVEETRRRDKTGSRTFLGVPPNGRRATVFETQTYLTSWSGSGEPAYGALFQSALGAPPAFSSGLTVRQVSSQTQFQTTTPHGLDVGSAVSWNNEIRFASAVLDATTISLNCPFSSVLMPGVTLAPTLTYRLGTALPSLTLYDYWDPISAPQRVITGAAVDRFALSVNADVHEFAFRGPAADIVDSASFVSGVGGLPQFPTEPAIEVFDYSVVPGHLGQAWVGQSASQLLTLTSASVHLKNNLETRHREFGATLPRAISPGMRQVAVQFSVLAQNDADSLALYQSSRTRTPLPAMFQLGQQEGQLMGLYIPRVTPEMPRYNDSSPRLEWEFQSCQAQGANNDELFIAFA